LSLLRDTRIFRRPLKLKRLKRQLSGHAPESPGRAFDTGWSAGAQEQIFFAEYPHAAQQGQSKCFLFIAHDFKFTQSLGEQRQPVSFFLQDGVVE
jgi:hypothetical protein